MSAEYQQALELIESLACEEAWAAEQITRYLKLVNDWRAEWTRLYELRQSWIEKIRPRPPAFTFPVLAEPIKLSIVEDEDAIQESVEHVGLSSEQGAGSVLRTVGNEAGESRAA